MSISSNSPIKIWHMDNYHTLALSIFSLLKLHLLLLCSLSFAFLISLPKKKNHFQNPKKINPQIWSKNQRPLLHCHWDQKSTPTSSLSLRSLTSSSYWSSFPNPQSLGFGLKNTPPPTGRSGFVSTCMREGWCVIVVHVSNFNWRIGENRHKESDLSFSFQNEARSNW